MLRPLATVCVLLLSLSGIVPAAVACAFTTQSADCCPMGQPCETRGAHALLAPGGSGCSALPAPILATVVVHGQSDRRFVEPPARDHVAAPAFDCRNSFPSPHARTVTDVASPIKIDQQQVYLRTGRLRL